MAIETLAEHRCFGGVQGFYRHQSAAIGLPMKFGVYLPPQAQQGPVPVLFFLAGLTCNEETFAIKAGAQRVAAELGLALLTQTLVWSAYFIHEFQGFTQRVSRRQIGGERHTAALRKMVQLTRHHDFFQMHQG